MSANFLDVLGASPLLGRRFAVGEDSPTSPPVLILGFEFWQRHLGGNPDVVGGTLQLDSTVYAIVGVMPAEFQTQFRGPVHDFWTTWTDSRTRAFELEEGYELIARLADGVILEQARREGQSIAADVAFEDWGEDQRQPGMVRLIDEVVRDSAHVLTLLLIAVGAVLAIACANLAQLMLARSDRRVREFATRKAMGATSGQLFRLAIMESMIVALGGGAAGLLLAYGLGPVLHSLAPAGIPRLADAAIDARVVTVAIALSLTTGCLFGAAPALRLSRGSITDAIRRGGAQGHRVTARFHSTLVVMQMMASVALFVLAGLLFQTFLTLLPGDPGFAAGSRATFVVPLSPSLFADAQDRRFRVDDLLRRIETHPGVAGATIASNIPFSTDEYMTPVGLADAVMHADSAAATGADVRSIAENYFDLLEMAVLRGRSFRPSDAPGATLVAIVNERLSRSLASNGDVIGRRVRIGNAETGPVYEVVGIVSDARSTGTSVEVLNEIYIPFAQSRATIGWLVVHASIAEPALTEIIRGEIRAVLPQLALRRDQRATALTELIGRSLARQRFAAMLVSAFSATALLLAVIGVFGLVSYSIAQRRRELGVRAALGARPRDLGMTTVRPVLTLTILGIVMGAMAAAYLTRFIESQLYAIEPLDPPTFVGAALGMLLVAGLAALIPARRATTTDPSLALRHE